MEAKLAVAQAQESNLLTLDDLKGEWVIERPDLQPLFLLISDPKSGSAKAFQVNHFHDRLYAVQDAKFFISVGRSVSNSQRTASFEAL